MPEEILFWLKVLDLGLEIVLPYT